ncbi:MAG: flavodoxin-dependent (E)-4-hydroxy-3-methylbut-2-enyl-diphosphate synthase [Bacilli bacterium]|nr:flavodoxin-dependent (E)-4-hydroxy-3-methylbut-2-enyl-diphosphate synthase [Bacilli bacterium]
MKTVYVRDIPIGNNHPIVIQSMTNTKTKDISATIQQINELVTAGSQIVRLAIADMEDAESIKEIKKQVSVPLVADIHFDYRLALKAIENGIDKLRLNPGNIKDKKQITEVVLACKEKKIPIRIGINGGSLNKEIYEKYGHTAQALIESANEHIKILEELDFHDIIISLKDTDIDITLEANRLASSSFNYPLHIGLTEAGTICSGTVRSSYVLGTLLKEKIGNTIRVSLTANPTEEIKVVKEILKMTGNYSSPTIISCPTCGRTDYNMLELINKLEPMISNLNYPLKVAIMGCVVNGPGEAKDADIGIAGGKNQVILFKKGQIVKTIKEENIINEFMKEIQTLIDEKNQE